MNDIGGLRVQLIKSVINQIYISLAKLFNQCDCESVFPMVLKGALITPVFKKGDKNLVTNYRPISGQIVCQFGFRVKRSTVMRILDLLDDIMDSFDGLECQSVFPRILKRALITHVFKKGNKNLVTNYRSISLLPIISKIFEKTRTGQIVKHFKTQGLFSKHQFGFRVKRSTVMGILDLLD